MPDSTLPQAYSDLFNWCRERNFTGFDPYDALKSRVFQATPLKHSRLARLAWTQLLKRSPLNLRRLALVPKGKTSKGLALFALASLANYRRQRTKEAERETRELLSDLLSQQLAGWSGAAWGYDFDWQSRVFLAPQGTPTIVPTAFAARALLEAAREFNDALYLDTARSTCDFILRDLPRSEETETEVCFGYSPGSKTRVYNASLLAAETIAGVGAVTGEQELHNLAMRATRYVVGRQRQDGAWAYGAEPIQGWVDNFHTAFVLSSLERIIRSCGPDLESQFSEALRRGYHFWRTRFFLADGWPKYYHDGFYPADAHAAATAIATLAEMRELDANALPLAQKIAQWSMQNLRDERGFFYYQRRRFYTVRTPFMRWTQGWMLYALARLLEEEAQQKR